MSSNNKGDLDVLLDEVRQASASKFTDEKKKIYADGISSVANSGVLDSALKVGDKAHNFTLKNALNESVTLYNELKNGPVVLTWYRGGWCPYCNITLHALQEKLPEFKKEGATLLALTPELPDNSLSTSEKNNLEFTVLSDLENTIGKAYGVVYTLTDDVATIYNAGFGLNKVNGDISNTLPLAATYVIDTNGIITYAFLDADYTQRAEPSEILSAVKQLK
ncbi:MULTISPECIES: peroxiredoxin-like family protein [unclassified Olleya]|jgi:peroxiredoxin|uniref:peroxiredoxin-like family protein n=1 Tax=unclassified Olleya TaxID=2615019 RepID=UPI0011A21BA1|nr:peroxiredoxin-like family protein [Olleya sp. Hel_I_94]TVZ46240.1 peroxiredoxin [Olleya sp. Hel_I_94]